MQLMSPTQTDTVLDIGVTRDTTYKESNFFEQFYPHKEQIVCVGTEDGGHLANIYAGLRFIPIQPDQSLPFEDQQFDLVFSNAVIEHVGSQASQKAFLAEACRVGKRVFITTPNRWFPVEHHTSVPLLHYLPKPLYRLIIRRTLLNYWADEQTLNLLTRRDFAGCFPPKYRVEIQYSGLLLGLCSSNLVAYTNLDR
jgi:SAM-dependent methyltransferase